MEIKVNHSNLQDTEADVILVAMFDGTDLSSGVVGTVDQALNGAISELVKDQDMRGKRNETAVLYSRGALPAPRVIVVGLGKGDDVSSDRVREAAGCLPGSAVVSGRRAAWVISLASEPHQAC